MPAIRLSKIVLLASIALFATLVAFGNITDYGSNFAFVEHVLRMDTIFPDATIGWRAIHTPALHHAAYLLIIATELAVAALCWLGAAALWRARNAPAADFNRAKKWGVVGLTLGFVLWQVGFMSIGGEWFGMWMSDTWNGLESAFRFFITIAVVLVYLAMEDKESGRV
ncbi:DUF2165 family protein [Pseudazoarcus pumilus]|uniref:DUF2165 domain-containing protein n=1 Tax=Pseudazoarcus pumilus TaxID=2067960 RepID=A0A2I6S2J6_9RHOO|nr:DUF2165 domain-containing protein [Pseudazoarcus pumilus]AUN93489.1 hypothetical protein C0099_00190 [Pseudazoarcus pumilus]